MHRSSRLLFVVVAALLFAPIVAFAQAPLAGRWEGAITVMGRDLAIVLTFSGEGAGVAGTIDIPAQGASGLALRAVKVTGSEARFELPAGANVARFAGTIGTDTLSGTFTQGPATGTFAVKRTGAAPAAEPPPPYRQEEVTVGAGAVTLAGTLTVPAGAGPHPAVVLITGSGAQNRDEELFGFKPFRIIADALTRGGVAVLRCDDRGVGGSTGDLAQATTADFAEDVLAEVRFLKARPDIASGKIGVLGHSEGGLVGPMAAGKSKDIAFVVMMSGPAVTGEKILLAQSLALGRAEMVPQEQIEANAALQRQIFAAARSGTGWDAVTKAARALADAAVARVPEAQRKAMGDVDALVRQQIAQQIAAAQTPWFKYFLDYDPAPALARLEVPLLAIFGEKDLQVPTVENRQALEAALAKGGHRHHRVEVLAGANHLYQSAKTGSASEYPTLAKAFVPGFLDLVTGWVREQTGLAAAR